MGFGLIDVRRRDLASSQQPGPCPKQISRSHLNTVIVIALLKMKLQVSFARSIGESAMACEFSILNEALWPKSPKSRNAGGQFDQSQFQAPRSSGPSPQNDSALSKRANQNP
jgi:hypothetical protein